MIEGTRISIQMYQAVGKQLQEVRTRWLQVEQAEGQKEALKAVAALQNSVDILQVCANGLKIQLVPMLLSPTTVAAVKNAVDIEVY